MPVKKVKQWSDDHRARGEAKTATCTLWYTVDCTPGTLPHEAEAGVPFGYGQALPGDPRGRVCTAIDAQAIPSSNIAYRVQVEFSLVAGLDGAADNPLSRVFRPQLEFEESREPIYVTADGTPIQNSAGDSFDPPIEESCYDPVITLVNNVAEWRGPTFMFYMGGVNVDGIFGASPGELKLTGATINPLEENGVKYYQEIVRISGRANRRMNGGVVRGWDRLVLDEGRYAIPDTLPTETTSADLEPIKDAHGDDVSDPKKLNGAGHVLKSGGTPASGGGFIISNDGKSVFRVVPPRLEVALSGLNLKFNL